MYHELSDRFIVSSSLEQAWEFFSTAENLPLITPPWLGFTNRSAAPVTIELGTVLDYTVRWLGVAIRWRTKIIEWSPPRQFIDLQVRGPYALWHHQHTFTPVAEGVDCEDRVIYEVPVPLVGRAVNALVVRRQLLDIFRYRRRVIGERLGWVRAVQADVEIKRL
jgi:ligand-binding SRPBCC domain-containing protein